MGLFSSCSPEQHLLTSRPVKGVRREAGKAVCVQVPHSSPAPGAQHVLGAVNETG